MEFNLSVLCYCHCKKNNVYEVTNQQLTHLFAYSITVAHLLAHVCTLPGDRIELDCRAVQYES